MSPLGVQASSESSGSSARLGWHYRLLRWAFHRWFRLTRSMTMGVRAMVLDGEGRVFLVRHTYIPGWHMPGGGIEAGQNALQSLAMELSEEGHIRMTGKARLFGIYQNREAAPRDHVLLYVVRDFVQDKPRQPDREIAEAGFFPLNALPAATTPATRRRLREVLEGLETSPFW